MNLKGFHWIGAILTLVLGSFVHFIFALSGGDPLIGAFTAVNESTWEHLKLLVTPMLLFTIIAYFLYGKKVPNFLPDRFLSILAGMAVIVILFYTYTGVTGVNNLYVDIGIFVIAVVIAYLLSDYIMETNLFSGRGAQIFGAAGLLFLVVLMILFTTNPPKIPLFRDPVTGGYGIPTS